MKDGEALRRLLVSIDGRGYKAYKSIAGGWRFGPCELYIDHVQGDPFAAPSKIRLRVAQDTARIPGELFDTRVRRIAAADFFGRAVRSAMRGIASGGRGSGKSGVVTIDAGGQEVLERTAVVLNERWIEARVQAGLPAAGRRILGREAAGMLCNDLPRIAESGLLWESVDHSRARLWVDTVDNYHAIRDQLTALDLVAFVPDGAVLPRESGASDRPLTESPLVPFVSPPEFRVELDVPNPLPGVCEDGKLAGMGIPRGVTLITGGGYHGKSTLLRALERGVYPHVPGDGRELVATDPAAVKIRAEDGRRVHNVDISAFISGLPFGGSTTLFSSEDASGSTSQAANIIEAIEVGATTLLLDEDTSATNFMIRDARMQALVEKRHEPITPFVDRVRELYTSHGISTILVMGGCGDYFDVADRVINMRDYLPHDSTAEARQVAADRPTGRLAETPEPMASPAGRAPDPGSFDPSRGRKPVRIDAPSTAEIRYGRHRIDLAGIEQLVDPAQTSAIGFAIHVAMQRFADDSPVIRQLTGRLDEMFDVEGLDVLDPYHREQQHPGCFARPRSFEIAAAINRLRTLRVAVRR
jgi:predicted ABC-class ATPase